MRPLSLRARMLIRALPVAALAAAAGCGSNPEFSASEFVAAVNEHGAELELGDPLQSLRDDGTSLYAVTIGHGDEAEEPRGHTHGGGTLTVAPGEEEAMAEHERCERAASLVCFRAANVVVFFEDDLGPDDQARISGALEALAGE